MLNKYLEWRKNEGKDYFRISKVNSKNYTTIDHFILKGINERNVKDFYCNWVLIKPALSSIPENCKTKTDIVKKYGRLNVAKVNVAINNAYEDKLIEKLILNLNKNMIEDKKYRYLGNINSFYYELCKKANLEVTLPIFTGIVSHFVEIKYRGE